MPMYDYVCRRCGNPVIRIRPVGVNIIECEVCKGDALKVPSVPAKIPVGKYGKGGGR